jgi:hypothetical protein
MNTNVVLAFVGGAVLASGIVYVAVKPAAAPKVASVSTTISKPLPAAAEPVAAVAPAQAAPEPVAAAPPEPEAKPSPMPQRERREKPVRVAQARRPLDQPLQQPINRQRPVNDAQQEPVAPVAQPAQPQPAPMPAAPAPAPASAPVLASPEPAPRVEPPPVEAPHTVTIQAGTVLNVRIGETLSTKRNQSGDTFLATLDQPLVVDGFVIAERGARVEGRVVEADPGGKVQGTAHLIVQLAKLNTADGQHVRISTASFTKQAGSSHGTDAAKIGAGAAIGAVIGAIAGGGKGAGIGAGVGGAAGAGDVLLTRGKPAEIPVETRLTFRIADPVELTERLN